MIEIKDRVKILLGGDQLDESQDLVIDTILAQAESRLLFILDEKTVPAELSFVLVEIATARFNRIGSEGVTSHSVGDESYQFSADDFLPYMKDIETWKERNKKTRRIRFL